MKIKTIIIGSRASKLAIAQANYARDRLLKRYPNLVIKIKMIKTTGDKILDVPLSKIGDKGLFTKEIEEALLSKKIDLAVHSLKDLPTQLPSGLMIGAVTKRQAAHDVLISKQGFTIKKLPRGSRVGTSSLRRRAQLLHIRPDLECVDLRGNLDTRIRKMNDGMYDAILLAHAGIKRLGLKLKLSVIPINEILPAAGQGALGIEIRCNDSHMAVLARALDDSAAHYSVDAERALLAGLEGGCQIPIGVHARVLGNKILVKSGVFSLDGKRAVKDQISGLKENAQLLGQKLALRMLKNKLVKQTLDEVKGR